MKKDDVLKIIDEVMNNREIDSIRNAILAIRDKVIEAKEYEDEIILDYKYPDNVVTLDNRHIFKIPLRSGSEVQPAYGYYEGANYLCIDVCAKIDTRIYGEMWYE